MQAGKAASEGNFIPHVPEWAGWIGKQRLPQLTVSWEQQGLFWGALQA